MCDQSQALRILGEVHRACDPVFGNVLRDAYLYGSYARGDYHEESDIDILIVSPNADDLRYKINRIAVDIILEKDEVISPHLMTEEHFNKTRNNSFLTNVLNEGVVLG